MAKKKISEFTNKSTPDSGDLFLIEQADGTYRNVLKSDIAGVTSGTNTGDETASRIAAINHGTSAKTTLVDADEVTGQDSASSFSLIRVTCLNVYNYLKTKFDLVYAALASPTFTGTPLAPNASFGTNTTQLANTAFVQAAMLPLQPVFSGKRRTTLKIAIGVSGGFQGKIYYTPYFTCKQHVVTKIGINVTIASAATNCKFALYADDGTGRPTGSALDFSGDISTATTGFKEYTFTGTRTLTDPVYWMAFQGQSGVTFEFVSSGPVVLEANGSIGFSQNQSYGSFPTVSGLTTQTQPTNVYMIPQ